MYVQACGALLLTGIILNFTNIRMLGLTLIIGFSIFFPVPAESAFKFYSFCIAFEVLVALLAWSTKLEAGLLIAGACVLLIVAHVMGYIQDGSTPLSPYHLLVKTLEFAELGICVALSPVVAPILRNNDATL